MTGARPDDEAARTAPRHVPRAQRMFWWAIALGLVAFLPFALVFSRTGQGATDPLVLTDADQKSLTDGLRMLSPSYSGRTEDGEPYTVRADWALPNGPKPTRITLSGIAATIVLKDGREAEMGSARGVFFPRRERLKLTDGVVAQTSDGYTVETPAALVDLKAKTIQTDGEIVAEGPRGSIRADGLEAMDAGGRMVIFRGNVRVVLVPEAASDPSNDP